MAENNLSASSEVQSQGPVNQSGSETGRSGRGKRSAAYKTVYHDRERHSFLVDIPEMRRLLTVDAITQAYWTIGTSAIGGGLSLFFDQVVNQSKFEWTTKMTGGVLFFFFGLGFFVGSLVLYLQRRKEVNDILDSLEGLGLENESGQILKP